MLDLQDLDTNTRPEDDFYQFANGGWIQNQTIPDDEASWNNFNILQIENTKKLHSLLEDLRLSNEEQFKNLSPNFQILKQFYTVGMDEDVVEKQGILGLKDLLEQINCVDSLSAAVKILARLHKCGITAGWEIIFDIDDKNSKKYVTRLYQNGLGMPDKDYYLSNEPKMLDTQRAYKIYIKRIFELLGRSQEDTNFATEKIYELEEKLAKASWDRVQCRDTKAMYNPTTSRDLSKNTSFPIQDYIKDLGLPKEAKIINSQPDFFTSAFEIFTSTPLKTIKEYLVFHTVSELSPALPQKFVENRFAFYGQAVTGAKTLLPRWRRALQIINAQLSQPLGELYVSKYFSAASKLAVEEMAENIFTAFDKRIQNLSWMGEQTKKAALKKLNGFHRKFGYPENWQDFSNLELSENYAENCLKAALFNFEYRLQRLTKPVDPTEWAMGAHTVNAYYWPNYNDIVFPAGILQFPFFNAQNDAAENYGAIGWTIGHEITHGFDDQGSEFDETGNLCQWWTEEDKKLFEQLGEKLIEQYNQCKVNENLHVNGKLTNGENIADLGGISIALDAYKLCLEKNPHKNKIIDGFTPEQRFFLAAARKWRGLIRPELEMMLINIDPHSPKNFRVNVPLSNLDQFYKAFEVKPGDGLYRPENERIKIW